MADGFKINKAYADKYNIWRQKEELQKLKDRYGDEEQSDDSSSSESEDEDAEALTEQLDKDWLRTLSALKNKDPRIYQKDVKFYHDDDEEVQKSNKKSKDKPMFLKDYERKVLLEKGGIVNEEEEQAMQDEPSTSFKSSLTYHQEQEQLRKSIVAAAASESDDESDVDEEENSLLIKREKTADEKKKEDFEFLEWLKGQKPTLEKDQDVGKELAPLKNYWEKKDLDEGEKFLKNYILNRQYIDKDDDEFVPTYDDIVNDEGEDFSDEEELLEKQASFERKYNFRFEEPDATEVKTFPRNFEESVRRKDTKRAEKRKDTKERKKKEKEKKKEELKQLKKLKRQEILDKIEKLKELTGNKKLGFDENDLDEDFDPAKHDEMMQKCFDDEYYGAEENDDTKPVFEMSDGEAEDWDNWTGDGKGGGADDAGENDEYYDDWNHEPGVDDPDFIMDADYDPEADRQRKKMKKDKKKKNKLAQALHAKKPVFDPNEKTFEEYFDEYYKLDYEDIIDDMPCRFKYRKVTPNNFGLTVDEILKSRDKELNAWVSVKKMSQFRTEEEEMHDVRVYESKGKNERKKRNILTSLYRSDDKDEEPDIVNKQQQQQASESKQGKKKRKRKGKKKPPNANKSQQEVNKQYSDVSKPDGHVTVTTEMTEDVNAKSKGINETKDGQIRHGQKRKADDLVGDMEVESNEPVSVKKSKKKKKNSVSDNVTELESFDTNVKPGNKFPENTGTVNTKAGDSVDSGKTDGSKKKKKKKKNKSDRKLEMSEERLKAYGINPKRYKYMKKEELYQVKPRKNKEKQP